MARLLTRTLTCSLLGLLLCGPLRAEPAAPELTGANIGRFFDAAFSVQSRQHRIVGALVAVVLDGKPVFERGYGWADLQTRTPADPDRSLFRIASISKLFVWTAVMQLIEAGRLDIDADVNEYLTEFRIPETYAEPVRIRHLLSHTAGFEDQAIGMNARSPGEQIPLATYLARHMPARVRPPGMQAAYSNWGTALAAHIVEAVSGEHWADYVDAHILTPLGMTSTNTHTIPGDDFAERMATSYSWSGGRFIPRPYEYMNDEPAGMMSTTAHDMSRFMLAHLNLGVWKGARILSEATARRMQSPLFDPHPGISPMLHGFYRSDQNGQLIFGHGGDTNQFHSNLSLFPEHGLGIFVSYNSDPADGARSRIITAFVDHFFPTPYLRPAPEPVPAVDLSDYVGEYIPLRSNESSLERLGILVTGIDIEAEEGELLFDGGSRWIPVGDDRFSGRYSEQTMVFERTDGQVSHVILGSPLNTFARARGLDAPGNLIRLMALMITIALAAVTGYGFRAFRRAPHEARLPAFQVIAAWVHGLLLIVLYAYLASVLSGDIEEFVFGVPEGVRVNIWLLLLNSLLGLAIIVLSARQWMSGAATAPARARYSCVGIAAFINLWIAWYFNILTFPFAP